MPATTTPASLPEPRKTLFRKSGGEDDLSPEVDPDDKISPSDRGAREFARPAARLPGPDASAPAPQP